MLRLYVVIWRGASLLESSQDVWTFKSLHILIYMKENLGIFTDF